MLLKNAKWSIVQRLTALYTLSTIVILLIISFALYASLKHSLFSESERQLLSDYQIISGLMKKQPIDIHTLSQEISVEPLLTEKNLSRRYSRILDQHGRVLLATPGIEEIAPLASMGLNFHTMQSEEGEEMSTHFYQGKEYLTLTLPIRLSGSVFNIIQVSMSIENQKGLLENYRSMIMGILVLGVILSLVLGTALARKSIQPLNKVTKKLKGLTTEQLHERLDETDLPEELIELALAFNAMCDGLEKSFNRLTQFSSDLAHELRTPINNLIGEAEIALSKQRSTEEYRQVLLSSLEESQRISQIVSGLLFLAQVESPQAKLVKKSINARELVDSVIDFYSAVAEEKSITLSCSGKAKAMVDEVLFRRVINNLLSNAIKYTPPHGTIDISLTQIKKSTVISIVDNGVGIAEKDLPFIFDRFYRADKARSQAPGGLDLGLGLAIVKSIIDIHDGHIVVSSELGRGTTMTLTV